MYMSFTEKLSGLKYMGNMCKPFYAPAYSKNSGRALSVTPVRPVRPSVRPSVRLSVRPSVCPSVRPTFVSGP